MGDIRGVQGEMMMKGREELILCGVTEVLEFDEMRVHLKSVDGELCIDGEGLKIGTLDTESGKVSLCGRVNGIYYATDPENRKKGIWGRIMR